MSINDKYLYTAFFGLFIFIDIYNLFKDLFRAIIYKKIYKFLISKN